MIKVEKEVQRSRPRLIEVAQEAGVSVQAVSHVLTGNSRSRISAETTSRILDAAKKVGYVPNRLAQSMRTGRTNIIAVWLPIRRPTTTYFRMLARLYDCAKDSGYALQIIGIENDLAYRGIGEIDRQWPVDGVIAIDAGKAIERFRTDPRNDATPVGVLAFEKYTNADTVGWDVAGAARDAVERMIRAGRRRIVFVAPQWVLDDYPREQRRRGYVEAMEAAGLSPIILPTAAESSDSAELTLRDYLASHEAPDGVFGFMDNLAMGSSRALLNAGLRIPEDCCVWGFGDIPEAVDFRVSLSSIRVPVDQLIDQAWDWLTSRIKDSELEPRESVLPMELIERDSTLRAPR